MSDRRIKVSYVVATKDRPGELSRLLGSLENQTRLPDEVIVVDGGDPVEVVCRGVRAFPVRYLRGLPPSGARQRNLGLGAAVPGSGFIGFLDDDVVLEESALEKMALFWQVAGENVGGASFNLRNHPVLALRSLKTTPFAATAGLYSGRPGAVSRAGFQTMIGHAPSTVYADWLPTTASVWKREIFKRFRFDEWFEGYSYLEDLDFSYRVGKNYRLAVVADAGYRHFPAASGRGSGYEFGTREVMNRVHFVLKHPELSLRRCRLALVARLLMTLGLAVRERELYQLQRAWGNVMGLAKVLGKTGSSA